MLKSKVSQKLAGDVLAAILDTVEKTVATTKTGTKTTFWPDPEIFTETTDIDVDVVATRFREMAFLNKGLKIVLHDEKAGKEETFHYEGGIGSYVSYLNQNKTVLFDEPICLVCNFDKIAFFTHIFKIYREYYR